jgi:hypothetical protein
VLTYALYGLADACWLPAAAIQMKAMPEAQVRGAGFSMRQNAGVCLVGGSCSVGRLSADWWLMVAKPTWQPMSLIIGDYRQFGSSIARGLAGDAEIRPNNGPGCCNLRGRLRKA